MQLESTEKVVRSYVVVRLDFQQFRECDWLPSPVSLSLRDLFSNIYGLLTKCEVKMPAGYWPSSFLRVYGPRRSRGP